MIWSSVPEPPAATQAASLFIFVDFDGKLIRLDQIGGILPGRQKGWAQLLLTSGGSVTVEGAPNEVIEKMQAAWRKAVGIQAPPA